ncbi:MAG: diacylglycerol kinase family protein [Planctomycetota bacterium]
MAKVAIICNPISGGGKSKILVKQLEAELSYHNYNITTFYTKAKGDAYQISSNITGNLAAVIPVGGDGTVNEVINGVCLRGIPVAPCPAGLSNVLCLELGIKPEPKNIVKAIESKNIVEVDISEASTGKLKKVKRFFTSMAGAGFDSEIVHSIANKRSSHLGFAGYAFPTLKAMMLYKYHPISVKVDGEIVTNRARYVIIGNVKYYGGPFYIATKACYNDNLLDVVVFEGRSSPEIIRFYLGVIRGNHLKHSNVRYFRGKEIDISAKQHIPVHIDGEAAGHLPVSFKIMDKDVSIVVPLR